MEKHIQELEQIFFAGVDRVDPYEMIRAKIRLEDSLLRISDDSGEILIDLEQYDRILVHGAGKATAKMALAVEELLAERLSDGVIAVKAGHTERLSKIRTIEAGHPVPDKESLRAAEELRALADQATERTLFLGLISGGGSACLCLPRAGINLEEQQRVTELLLSCGADIGEINTVRKHLSAIKGGGLARMLSPATSINIILSDVVGDRLDSIASGLTVPDGTTFADALHIVERYSLRGELPESVQELLDAGAAGRIEETPKPGDPAFADVRNVLLGTNRAALNAAAACAQDLGYNVLVLSSQITGEAREIAKFYHAIAADLESHGLAVQRPACVLGGGETTVTLRGSGRGGRNQELALSFLTELSRRNGKAKGIYFLSAGTDGNDGPTDAAGAFACREAAMAAAERGLDLEDYLARNDSYALFDEIGYLFKPGPTNTNVCDLQILLVV